MNRIGLNFLVEGVEKIASTLHLATELQHPFCNLQQPKTQGNTAVEMELVMIPII